MPRKAKLNSNNCPACSKRKPYKRSMRLCAVCWKLVRPDIQGKIASGYNPQFEDGSVQMPAEWLALVQTAVLQAAEQNPQTEAMPGDYSANNLAEGEDANGATVKERDYVRITETGTLALVLRFTSKTRAIVRLLGGEPETVPMLSGSFTLVTTETKDGSK